MGTNLKGEDDLRETNINKKIAFKNVKIIIYVQYYNLANGSV
jgi:hypothetical protein